MCDDCDCRSHPVIAGLSEDHDRLLGLLAELRRAADVDDDVSAVVGELHRVLDTHAEVEERRVLAEIDALTTTGARS